MKKYIFFFFTLLMVVHTPLFAGIKVAVLKDAKMFWSYCSDPVVVNPKINPYKPQFEITLYYTSNRGSAKLQVTQNENSSSYIPVDLGYNSRIKLKTFYRFILKISTDGKKIDNIEVWEIGCPKGKNIKKIDAPLVNCAPNCLAVYAGSISTDMKDFYSNNPLSLEISTKGQPINNISDLRATVAVIPLELISPYIDKKDWQGGQAVLRNYHQDLINKKLITSDMPEMDFNNFLKVNQVNLDGQMNTGKLFIAPEIKKKFQIQPKN